MEITEIDSLTHTHNIVVTFLQNFVKSTNFLYYIIAAFTNYLELTDYLLKKWCMTYM